MSMPIGPEPSDPKDGVGAASPIYRFRCSHCEGRLKTPIGNLGQPIICPLCEHLIIAQKTAAELAEDDALAGKFDGESVAWVRAQCVCGKVVKAPAVFAGRTGSCPECSALIRMPRLNQYDVSEMEISSTFVDKPTEAGRALAFQATSETEPSSDVLDTMDDTPEPADNAWPASRPREVVYERIKPEPEESTRPEDLYVRAACVCGAEVHAESRLAGRVVACPSCKRTIHLPLRPQKRPVFDFDAMAEEDLSFGGESAVFAPEHISAGYEGGIYPDIDHSKSRARIAVPQAQDEDAGQGMATAGAAATLPGHGLSYRLHEWRRRYSDALDEVNRRPAVKFGGIAALMMLAGLLVSYQFQQHWIERTYAYSVVQPATKVYFYDTRGGTLYQASSDVVPPAAAPGQDPGNREEFAGVRAYRFSCGRCDDADTVFVGLVEAMLPDFQKGWEQRMLATGVRQVPSILESKPADQRGRHIARPDRLQFVDPLSAEGRKLMQDPAGRRCPGDSEPTACAP